jgi:hypothetical protein
MSHKQRDLLNHAFAALLLVIAGILLVGLIIQGTGHLFSYVGPPDDFLENSSTLKPSTYSVYASDQLEAEAESIIEDGWQGGPHATLTFAPQELQSAEGPLRGTFRLEVPEELKRIVWDGRTNQSVAYETETDTGNPILVLKPQYEDEAFDLRIENRLDQPSVYRRIP